MIGEQKTKDEGYVSVATKVPAHVAELLTILARMRGMEVYELLQLLVNGFIAYAKAETDVPNEFRNLYDSLKFDAAWNNAYNFASPTAQQDIAQMILVLQQPGKTGFGLAMIDKPFISDARMTTSIPLILARVLELSLGFRDFVDLRQMVAYHGAIDMLDLIRKMITAQTILDIEDSDREELPGYGEHHDYGKLIEYGKKHKRVPHRTPDSVAQQQTIRFEPEDVPDLPELQEWEGNHRQLEELPEDRDLMDELSKGHALDDDLESEMGFRPFGSEW